MNVPTLTIGVSFYNTANTLHDLARCVFSQTFTDWEWILVDDGSTDKGGEIAQRIDDPRVRVISDGRNLGRSERYNQITSLARGEFIARFDADDMCDPLRFEKQVGFLRSHSNVDIVSTDEIMLSEDDKPTGRTHNPTTHEEIFANPLKGVPFAHPPAMARKTMWERYPYPTCVTITVDYAMYLASYRDNRYANIPEPLLYYRVYATHSLRKYFWTNVAVAKLIGKYGPPDFSRGAILVNQFARYARIAAYAMATAVGQQDRLLARRSTKDKFDKPDEGLMTKEDVSRFEEAMGIIRQTDVPGIDT